MQQAVDAAPVHEVGADEAGEGERAVDRPLSGLGEAQQQEVDQRCRSIMSPHPSWAGCTVRGGGEAGRDDDGTASH